MTPCEKLGYNVGDEFVVVETETTFERGSKVRLIDDDGTSFPKFEGVGCKGNDGGDWNFMHLSRVKPAGGEDIITRTNGRPFATESSARQQLAAKRLQGTHEVVPHAGGDALVPKKTATKHKLQVGDKVRVNGHRRNGDEHQYGTSLSIKRWMRDNKTIAVVEVDGDRIEAGDEEISLAFHVSELDLVEDMVIDTADPITTLKQARQARDEAEQAYQQALADAREYLGEGFALTEAGSDAQLVDGEDMDDPANWREGDVLECVKEWPCGTKGKLYTVMPFDRLGAGRTDEGVMAIQVDDDVGDESTVAHHYFRFHHRPK